MKRCLVGRVHIWCACMVYATVEASKEKIFIKIICEEIGEVKVRRLGPGHI